MMLPKCHNLLYTAMFDDAPDKILKTHTNATVDIHNVMYI
jgi:hypothetical protein